MRCGRLAVTARIQHHDVATRSYQLVYQSVVDEVGRMIAGETMMQEQRRQVRDGLTHLRKQ